jgi:hypothetical protein
MTARSVCHAEGRRPEESPRALRGRGGSRSFAALRMTAACFLAALLCASCQERGRAEPGVQMAVSHEREAPETGTATEGGAGSAGAPKVPTRLVVPPEVAKTYSGVRVSWKNSGNGKEGTLDVPLGGSAHLPDSEMEVRCDAFLPAFTMAADEITSNGVEPTNPAARVSVVEKGNEIFSGWIFTNFPDVHPFQHPRFSLRLAGGVRQNSK